MWPPGRSAPWADTVRAILWRCLAGGLQPGLGVSPGRFMQYEGPAAVAPDSTQFCLDEPGHRWRRPVLIFSWRAPNINCFRRLEMKHPWNTHRSVANAFRRGVAPYGSSRPRLRTSSRSSHVSTARHRPGIRGDLSAVRRVVEGSMTVSSCRWAPRSWGRKCSKKV